MAVGIWDISLAQALAEEMGERHWHHTQHKKVTGQTWQAKKNEDFAKARSSRKIADEVLRRAYYTLRQQPGGMAKLKAYLDDPWLCGYCLNVRYNLKPCQRHCGRKLCPDCRTTESICPNQGNCNHSHWSDWRAAIKVIDMNDPLYAEWRAAADIADEHTKRTGRGRRPAALTAAHAGQTRRSLSQQR